MQKFLGTLSSAIRNFSRAFFFYHLVIFSYYLCNGVVEANVKDVKLTVPDILGEVS